MACKHGDYKDGGMNVICSIISDLVGLQAGLKSEACKQCEYPNNSSFVDAVAKERIRQLLITGNQPRFYDRIDVAEMAARFKSISSKAEREELLYEAFIFQSIPAEIGGQDESAIETYLKDLERELDIPRALREIQ